MMQWLLLSNNRFYSKSTILRQRNFRENNIDESKIVFVHGRIEDVKLPVDKVNI